MATYSADISVKVKGLAALEKLENRVKAITSAAGDLESAFAGLNISKDALASVKELSAEIATAAKAQKALNKELAESVKQINAQASATKKVASRKGSSSSAIQGPATPAEAKASQLMTIMGGAARMIFGAFEKLGGAVEQALDPTMEMTIEAENLDRAFNRVAKVSNSWRDTLRDIANWQKEIADSTRKTEQAASDAAKKRLAAAAAVKAAAEAEVAAKAKAVALEQEQADIAAMRERRENLTRIRRSKVQRGRQRQEDLGNMSESLMLGVGFPLLFGAGPGSIAGSAAGSFMGKGFGGQIFFGALGAQLDAVGQAAIEAGRALRDPIENFEDLVQKGILASNTQEKYVRGLIEAGKAYEALAIIQQEVIKKVGVEGAKDLERLGDNAAKLSRTWQEFNFQLQAALSGPMADLLGWLNSVLAIEVQTGRKNAATTDFLTQLRKESPVAYQEYLSRSRALAEANGGAVNDAQVLALRKEYLPGGVKQAIKSTPAAELASKTRAGEISELQAEVDLSAKRLALTGLTLERDGQRYVIAARNVAQQEYENRLLEIKNSWIGKVFDKEKNLAMIRAANLKLANDIKGIEYEIAQNQEQQYTAALQVDSQRAQEALRTMDLNEQIARTQDGELAALYNTIMLMDKRTDRQQEILQNEYDIAMVEARRNGTQAAVDALYTARLENLKKEAALNKMIAQQKLAQLKIEEEFERRRQNIGFRTEEQNVLLGAPSNRNPLEEALYQIDRQQTDLLGPKLDRVQELKDLLAQPEGVFSTEQVLKYKNELSDLEVNILTLGGNFDKLRGMTRVWSDQQVQVEALAMAVNGFGNSITNVFGNLINQTQSWNDVLQNTLLQLSQLLFSAGLNALGGSDGRGFFSILNGTFTGRASGGTVNGGTPYMVGEKGPELFVPGRTGTIVPNDQLGGGGTVVNITLNGVGGGSTTSAGTNKEEAAQLARMVEGAVTGILIRERRPGGLLAR